MKTHTRMNNRNLQSACLAVAIENTVTGVENLAFVIAILKKRFNLQISFTFRTPELLFFNKRLLQWITEGQVDRIFITDDPDAFWLDYVESAKRIETDRIFFAELHQLLSGWTNFIKFFVETLGSEFDITQSNKNNYFSASQKFIRCCQSCRISPFKNLYLSSTTEPTSTSDTNPKNPNNSSLFTTTQGVERFGGTEQFQKLNILIDGHQPSSYRRIWQIDNNLDTKYFCLEDIDSLRDKRVIRVPGIICTNPESQLIADITPAQYSSCRAAGSQHVPRQLLTITSCKSQPLQDCRMDAIFVMSNYNKEQYIASALYSIAMQTHQRCRVHIIDDASTDRSMSEIKSFAMLFKKEDFDITIEENSKSNGTYRIRNSIIHRHIKSDKIYLVNDSDDFSSCQRAHIQLNLLNSHPKPIVCFGDIVRVDANYKILALDGKVERYGTASLASKFETHQEFGYYENIRKNADTEFIERLRHFSGKNSIQWLRYPILFQPFDGSNLTSDIYKVDGQGKSISSDLSQRQKHRELYLAQHKRIKTPLHRHYTYPHYAAPKEYVQFIPEFLA